MGRPGAGTGPGGIVNRRRRRVLFDPMFHPGPVRQNRKGNGEERLFRRRLQNDDRPGWEYEQGTEGKSPPGSVACTPALFS